MAAKKKPVTLAQSANPNPVNMTLLAQIVAATQASSFVYTSANDHTPMVAAGLVQLAPPEFQKGPNGEIATAATPAGIEMVQKAAAAQGTPVAAPSQPFPASAPAASSAPAVQSQFEIEIGVPMPVSKRGAAFGERKPSIYPFDKLDIGQSFFIAPTADHPEPWKSLASTVSSASRRYAHETGQFKPRRSTDDAGNQIVKQIPIMRYDRKFAIRSDVKNGVNGARVFRVDPNAVPPAA